jgi:hypothetical protein
VSKLRLELHVGLRTEVALAAVAQNSAAQAVDLATRGDDPVTELARDF